MIPLNFLTRNDLLRKKLSKIQVKHVNFQNFILNLCFNIPYSISASGRQENSTLVNDLNCNKLFYANSIYGSNPEEIINYIKQFPFSNYRVATVPNTLGNDRFFCRGQV